MHAGQTQELVESLRREPCRPGRALRTQGHRMVPTTAHTLSAAMASHHDGSDVGSFTLSASGRGGHGVKKGPLSRCEGN